MGCGMGIRRCTTIVFSAALAMTWPFAASASEDLVGSPTTFTVTHATTLMDVARTFDVGFVAIRAANPGVSAWAPRRGVLLQVPTTHILPDAPRNGIVINLAEQRLYYYASADAPPVTFPLGIGGAGKQTPLGTTQVLHKQAHPQWVPTASEHADNPDLPAVVPPGPNNPMGKFAMYLGWQGYAIHGTNKPDSIGRRDSHGCIRMYPEDIQRLFHEAAIGTQVTVVDQPAKVGWSGDQLYLEVHSPQADAESLEDYGIAPLRNPEDADDLVTRAAGTASDRIDWTAVHRIEEVRSGLPEPILLPPPAP